MLSQPLAEVFGFPISNDTKEVVRLRKNKLCPFNNKVPSCTKDKAKDPLGVCSIYHNSKTVITCPVRFRENWTIAEDAAEFFFKSGRAWTSIAEVNLPDKGGKTAGHIDLILVEYDECGRITDFGALEVQAVYISGNIRTPFEFYMKNQTANKDMSWKGKPNYPKPDFLSSSRKRLVPQILFKGGILNSWKKKQAIALQTEFFNTLPQMPQVAPEQADIAWLLYDLVEDTDANRFRLQTSRIVYTEFAPALDSIMKPQPGNLDEFVNFLQEKLDERLEGSPPDAPTLTDELIQ